MGIFGVNIEKLEARRDVRGIITFLVKNKDLDSRQRAIKALVRIGEPALEYLKETLNDKDPNVRKTTAWALGEIRDPRAIEPLIFTVLDDGDIRTAGEAALTHIDPNWYQSDAAKRTVPRLVVECLLNPIIFAQYDLLLSGEYIVKMLNKIDPNYRSNEEIERRITALIEVLKEHGDSATKLVIPAMLGVIREPRAVDILIAILQRDIKDSGQLRAVEMALRKITGQDFGRDFVKWQKWWEQNKEDIFKGR